MGITEATYTAKSTSVDSTLSSFNMADVVEEKWWTTDFDRCKYGGDYEPSYNNVAYSRGFYEIVLTDLSSFIKEEIRNKDPLYYNAT